MAMKIRQSSCFAVPKIWLMTDPRLDDCLLSAIQRLPMRSGVVFRHYHLALAERRQLFAKVRRICKRRGHMLVLAGDERQALHWHADGFHGAFTGAVLQHTMAVHNSHEIAKAKQLKADIVFLSPLYATQSHPGAPTLGIARFQMLAGRVRAAKVMALGGMTRNRACSMAVKHVYGWAAIDAFHK